MNKTKNLGEIYCSKEFFCFFFFFFFFFFDSGMVYIYPGILKPLKLLYLFFHLTEAIYNKLRFLTSFNPHFISTCKWL